MPKESITKPEKKIETEHGSRLQTLVSLGTVPLVT